MSADRPINADVPEDDGPEEQPASEPEEPAAPAEEPENREDPKPEEPASDPTAEEPPSEEPETADVSSSFPPGERTRHRRRVPGAIKLVAALVALAIAFIVLVIVAGGGGSKDGTTTATVTEATTATPLAEVPSEVEGGGEGGSSSGGDLAFPLVATDNTTRIGGAAPAENAAAAALAVFPSTTDKQRPAAVALVDESEWPTAVAAAALMAPPVRAPLLFTADEKLPAATEAALGALAPTGSDATKGTREFVLGEADTAVAQGPDQKRIRSEAGPVANAADIAELRDELFGSLPEAVIVAPLEDGSFAAPAAAWAARSGDPVLFAEKSSLPEPTGATLKRYAKVPVYVLGPKSEIADSVLAEIRKFAPKVKRIAGKDPVANAIAFARFADGSFGWGVDDPGHGFVLARADSPLDAAAASPLSAAGTWGPLLLTDGAATLPPELRKYFLDVKPGYTDNPTRAYYNHVWVVGDGESIGVGQQAEVNELAELAKIGEQ